MSMWQRTSGQVDAPASRVHRSTGFLDGAQVVARLEYDPQDPTSAWATVAVDQENRVAVLGEDGQEVVAGPPLAELVAALADEVQGVVTFAEETARALPPGEGDEDEDDDPFDPQIGIVVVADRALVCTTADRAGLERLATEADAVVQAVPTPFGHAILVQDGPAVADLPLGALGNPAVVLQQTADYPALGITGDDEYQYVWGLQDAIVPLSAPAAEQFADTVLGLGALVAQVVGAVPGTDAEIVRRGLESGSGPLDVLPGLLGQGSAGALDAFLAGRTSVADLDEVITVEPVLLGEAVRRRAQEAADDARRAAEDARRAASQAADDTRRRAQEAADDARRRAQHAADDARRMADEARAGAAAFADAAEEPVRTWAPYAAAGVDLVVGALLWRRSGRAARAGERMGAGAKVVRGVSVLLFAAAATNVVAAVVDRRRASGTSPAEV